MKDRIQGMLAIPVVVGGMIGFGFAIHSLIYPEMSDEDLANTKTFCSGIQVPSSFVKLSEFNLAKSNFASFETNYSSETDPRSVEEHFRQIFPADRWTTERHTDSDGVALKFREGLTSVTLRYHWFELTSDHRYFVTCSFNR